MKKFILSLAAFLYLLLSGLSFPAPALFPRAADQAAYACIRGDSTYLYRNRDQNGGLFVLPRTYYVKVLEEGVDFCYVQYQRDGGGYKALYGYCKTPELTFVDYVPETPFLSYTLSVSYTLDGAASSLVNDSVLSSITVSYAYYGDYTVGSSVYRYVVRDGECGYLPKTGEISYETNEEYDRRLPADSSGTPSEEPSGNDFPVSRVILFSILGILVVCFAYYLLRPKETQPLSSPADEFGFTKDDPS